MQCRECEGRGVVLIDCDHNDKWGVETCWACITAPRVHQAEGQRRAADRQHRQGDDVERSVPGDSLEPQVLLGPAELDPDTDKGPPDARRQHGGHGGVGGGDGPPGSARHGPTPPVTRGLTASGASRARREHMPRRAPPRHLS